VTLIYHLAEAADWEQARREGQYAMSTRGRTLAEEGFFGQNSTGNCSRS